MGHRGGGGGGARGWETLLRPSPCPLPRAPGAAGFRTPRPADPWPDNLALAGPKVLPPCGRGEGRANVREVSSLWHACACVCARVSVYACIHVCLCVCVCPRARLRVGARARVPVCAPLRGDADAGKDESCSFLSCSQLSWAQFGKCRELLASQVGCLRHRVYGLVQRPKGSRMSPIMFSPPGAQELWLTLRTE